MCNKHCSKFNYLISEDLRKYLLSFSSVEFGICLGVSCGDIIMRCYRLGILVQKNRGILLSWNLITDLESWYGLGLECIPGLRSGRTDVRCTFEINTENLIRLNMIGHNVGT